jgi:hypothetical protein
MRANSTSIGRCTNALWPLAEHDKLAAVPRQHDLGCGALLPVLVFQKPGLYLTFDVDPRPRTQIPKGDLGELLIEDRDVVPFGTLTAHAAFSINPAFGRHKVERNDDLSDGPRGLCYGLRIGHCRSAAEMADQDHFVDIAGHAACFSNLSGPVTLSMIIHAAEIQ